MVQNTESEQGKTISDGVWATKLFEHIEHFNSNTDLEELKYMLPFGLKRQKKPNNYEKKQENIMRKQAEAMMQSKLGMFYKEPDAEIKPWKPKLNIMQSTEDFSKYKPTKFVLRNDPKMKKVMYFEQDLMAKPVSENIDKRTGFSYRLNTDKNVFVRKFIVMVSRKNLIKMVHEFIEECNRILYLYCDTN